MLLLLAQHIHHKKLVREYLNLSFDLNAGRVLFLHGAVHATCLAVVEPPGRRRAQNLSCLDILWPRIAHIEILQRMFSRFLNGGRVFASGLDRNHHFFGPVVRHDLSTQRQGVGDRSPEWAFWADAGVLRVHLQARVRAFDLRKFLMHTLMRIGVQLRQLLCVHIPVSADFCPRQQPSPEWLHPVLLRVVLVELQLGAANTPL